MATINESSFATHYLAATEWMLDALSNPSAQRWLQARRTAVLAKGAAYGNAEEQLAMRLLFSVMDTAKSQGYTGFGE